MPIRVELKGLTEDDMYSILTEPVTNMIKQQTSLLATEGVELVFEDEAIREIARVAALLNKTVENIGARRLHTVIERIVEERRSVRTLQLISLLLCFHCYLTVFPLLSLPSHCPPTARHCPPSALPRPCLPAFAFPHASPHAPPPPRIG